jgi:solute carrier family 25 (mitochondrial phosphate transporter), member 23/24/25/41
MTHLELWSIFHEQLDLDGNGHLEASELNTALSKAGARAFAHPIRDLPLILT